MIYYFFQVSFQRHLTTPAKDQVSVTASLSSGDQIICGGYHSWDNCCVWSELRRIRWVILPTHFAVNCFLPLKLRAIKLFCRIKIWHLNHVNMTHWAGHCTVNSLKIYLSNSEDKQEIKSTNHISLTQIAICCHLASLVLCQGIISIVPSVWMSSLNLSPHLVVTTFAKPAWESAGTGAIYATARRVTKVSTWGLRSPRMWSSRRFRSN